MRRPAMKNWQRFNFRTVITSAKFKFPTMLLLLWTRGLSFIFIWLVAPKNSVTQSTNQQPMNAKCPSDLLSVQNKSLMNHFLLFLLHLQLFPARQLQLRDVKCRRQFLHSPQPPPVQRIGDEPRLLDRLVTIGSGDHRKWS